MFGRTTRKLSSVIDGRIGGRWPYPKHVFCSSGGYWTNPKKWAENTRFYAVPFFGGALTFGLYCDNFILERSQDKEKGFAKRQKLRQQNLVSID
eukprot:g47701.t1